MTTTWLSPAKLNLFLHIVGRRADGYHELQTVFQIIDRCDELTFMPRADGRILLTDDTGVPVEQNLVKRAAKLLQQSTQTSLGATIYLKKRIPMGGGLGGGSSNAATTLIALNRLWNLELSQLELSKLSLQLGADVPIFVYGQSAWAEGIGEKFTPIQLDTRWYLVIVPPCTIPTVEIFSDKELTRDTAPITIHEFLADPTRTRNDMEAVVRKRYPSVGEALDWLNQYAPAHLTGSGSCIFAVFNDEAQAQAVLQHVKPPLQGFVAQGLQKSPLFSKMQTCTTCE